MYDGLRDEDLREDTAVARCVALTPRFTVVIIYKYGDLLAPAKRRQNVTVNGFDRSVMTQSSAQ